MVCGDSNPAPSESVAVESSEAWRGNPVMPPSWQDFCDSCFLPFEPLGTHEIILLSTTWSPHIESPSGVQSCLSDSPVPRSSPCSSRDAAEVGHTVQESQLFQSQQVAIERGHGPGTSSCGHDPHDGDLDHTKTQAGLARTGTELPPASREGT